MTHNRIRPALVGLFAVLAVPVASIDAEFTTG